MNTTFYMENAMRSRAKNHDWSKDNCSALGRTHLLREQKIQNVCFSLLFYPWGNHPFLALSLMETSPSFKGQGVTSPCIDVKFLLVVMTLQNCIEHSLAFNAAPLAS